jgi:hypothetical protein
MGKPWLGRRIFISGDEQIPLIEVLSKTRLERVGQVPRPAPLSASELDAYVRPSQDNNAGKTVARIFY